MHKYLSLPDMGPHDFDLAFLRHPLSVRNEGGNEISIDPASAVGQFSDREMPVSEKGLEQIAATVPGIIDLYPNPAVIIHSGYARTLALAEALAKGYEQKNLSVPLVWDVRIRERDQGCNAHMVRKDCDEHFPWMDDYVRRLGPLYFRPPSGESLADVMLNRTIPFLEYVCRQYKGKTVIVCGHGRFMTTVRWAIEDNLSYEAVCELTLLRNSPLNCSLLAYEYFHAEDRLVKLVYNDVFYSL